MPSRYHNKTNICRGKDVRVGIGPVDKNVHRNPQCLKVTSVNPHPDQHFYLKIFRDTAENSILETHIQTHSHVRLHYSCFIQVCMHVIVYSFLAGIDREGRESQEVREGEREREGERGRERDRENTDRQTDRGQTDRQRAETETERDSGREASKHVTVRTSTRVS